MDPIMEKIKTEKNKESLIVDGFQFVKNKEYNGKTYWICSEYRKQCCKVRIHTINGTITSPIGEHTHAGNASFIGVKRSINEFKENVLSTTERPQRIICNCSTTLSNAVRPHMPSIPSMQRTAQRIRQGTIPLPRSATDLVVLDKYRITKDGEPFLLFDSGASETRFLIFSTKTNLNILSQSSDWYVDGTFKVVPLIFKQLFTIHGFKEKLSVPLVFALLPNKSSEIYKELFDQLKILCPNLEPIFVFSDFEQAIVKAVKSSFSSTKQKFCYFHFCQNLYRKLCAVGFKTKYDQDAEFSHKIRMLLALAFIPSTDVIRAFEALIQNDIISEEVTEVLDYFEDSYIGRLDVRSKNISGRRDPVFAIEAWNVYQATQEEKPRTNNSVEGWHNGFGKLVAAEHPTIWDFLEKLQLEQSKNEMVLQQIISGMPLPPKKKEISGL